MPVAEDEWKEQAQHLLRAAQDGDATARGQLLERYRKYLSSIAEAELASDLRPKAGPSDLVQDTLLEAHRYFARFDGAQGDEFRAWLRGILLNKLAQLHRHYHEAQKRAVGREVPFAETGRRLGRGEDAARMCFTTALERSAIELGDTRADREPAGNG